MPISFAALFPVALFPALFPALPLFPAGVVAVFRISSPAPVSGANTILLEILTRMKLLFSNYLGDYSYSFQGSSEIISITVTVSLFF